MSFRKYVAWKALKQNPGVHARDLAKILGWTDYNCAKAMQWLVKRGNAEASGYSHARRFYATVREPIDTRGLATGSIRALKVPANYMENLAKANAVRHKMMADGTYRLKRRKQIKYAERVGDGATLLEQCWKFPSTLAIVRNTEDNRIKARRGPSCVETPEDKEAA